MKNFGLYIHIPFCKKKCFYCDFFSIVEFESIPKYIDALCTELKFRSDSFIEKCEQPVPYLDSIFIGGGTPSLLNSMYINNIFDAIRRYYRIAEDCEITIECNPAAVDSKYFEEYKEIGINRISIGVQSFSNSDLTFLQRLHSSKEALETIDKALKNFDNVSIDLIYGNPEQTIIQLEKNIEIAINLGVPHISAYNLIFEENTPLYDAMLEGKISEKTPDDSADMYIFLAELLIKNGYNHYEISNFAKNGFESRHNLKYWSCSNVIAVGASSVGYINGKRYKNHRNISKYIKDLATGNLPQSEVEVLSSEEMLEEFIFLSLRSTGLNFNNLKKKYDIDLLNKAKNVIFNFVENGFAIFENNLLKLTPKGYFVVDEISLRFMQLIEFEE